MIARRPSKSSSKPKAAVEAKAKAKAKPAAPGGPKAKRAAKPAKAMTTPAPQKTKTKMTKAKARVEAAAKTTGSPTARAAIAAFRPASSEPLPEVLRGGQAWSRRLARGQILRITDVTGHAAVAGLFYNVRDPLERYNMADTLKAQYTAFLTAGRVLYSDMGRILVSIVADTCGWHDTIAGCEGAAASDAHFGSGSYQELRNQFHRNTRDNFVVELSKLGLGRRDIVANVSFFVRVFADDSGQIAWVADNSSPGAYVDLRAEMDTLVVLSNTPHPLDPSTTYEPPPIELAIRWATAAELPGPDDPCRLSRPENGRGFALTEAYNAEVAATVQTTAVRHEAAR